MRIIDWKKAPTAYVIIIILITASVGSIIVLSSQLSHIVEHGGTPIEQTRFADLVDTELGPAMYPGAPLIVTDTAVRMSLDYRLLTPIITLNESLDIALQFLSEFSYLSGLNLTPDPVWNMLIDNEYYTLRFFHDQTETYAAVSAISGEIISFSPSRAILSPLAKTPQDSQMLNTEDVEDSAFDFLDDHNYTFSPHTRYEGPTLIDDRVFVGFWVYRLHFFCVINGSRVSGNGISLQLDIETGEVLHFIYRWSDILSVPVDNIMSAREAEQNTINFFVDEKGATALSVTKTQLWFYTVHSYPIREYWLCWLVEVEHQYYTMAIVNAIGGEVLDYGGIAI